MSIDLGTCGICDAGISIKDNHPASFLKCDHFFHTPCITDWRKEKNSCPTCQKVIMIIPFKLPWTLTLDSASPEALEKALHKKKLFPSNKTIIVERKKYRFPSAWRKKWSDKVKENDGAAVKKILNYYLKRIQELDREVLNLYFWARKANIITINGPDESFEAANIIKLFYDFNFYLKNLNTDAINSFKLFYRIPEETSDAATYKKIKELWECMVLDRWTTCAELLFHDFPPSEAIRTSIQKDTVKGKERTYNFYQLILQYRNGSKVNQLQLPQEDKEFQQNVSIVLDILYRAGIVINEKK